MPLGEARAWRFATLFVAPYVLLAMAWLGSNPPGAAPDAGSHLIKALGVARLEVGVPYAGPVPAKPLVLVRNASITRVVTVPARLVQPGFTCFAFRPEKTADCQPAPKNTPGVVAAATAMGAYPPFVYLPMGLAASAASTTPQAWTYGGAVVLVETMVLLWLACWHLVRWLGRRALLGVMLGVTPLAVFCAGILNTSGLEIFGALGVASVVAVSTRRPESLASRGTQAVMLVSGSALVLSRQLGIVTMGTLVVLLLAVGGWQPIWQEVRHGSRLMIATLALFVVESLAVAGWEVGFDHPAVTGPWYSLDSIRALSGTWLGISEQAVGRFGWVDVRMAPWVTSVWLVALAALLLWALVRGGLRDRLVVVAMALGLVILAVVTYATVFYPIQAGLQGRHLVPFFVFLPVFAGIVVAERMGRRTFAWVVTLTALVLPSIHFYGLYLNGKRYAVGLTSGPAWFLPDARWSPPLGWLPWLVLGFVACVGMLASWVQIGRTGQSRPTLVGPPPDLGRLPAR